ncbi:MAG: hypothetical protein sL5_10090 [Candidatus Mesenet longicola]|uniref:Uncharacterized protein n=1 Tax=Candidatus Mesenet longicola TaxID=1892558 RepID=A0A8J3HYQ4_9RICK|nr:MAG: hypothetical protein sGL2_02810 [Candidatus Mesenet longicola]GHM60016.1 MAG: hypothetical protein sL5_10090 [Candidatus Mesenet longicola]
MSEFEEVRPLMAMANMGDINKNVLNLRSLVTSNNEELLSKFEETKKLVNMKNEDLNNKFLETKELVNQKNQILSTRFDDLNDMVISKNNSLSEQIKGLYNTMQSRFDRMEGVDSSDELAADNLI